MSAPQLKVIKYSASTLVFSKSKKSQVGVKNPKLMKKMKNKVIQQAWNNNFTHSNFYNFTVIRQNSLSNNID